MNWVTNPVWVSTKLKAVKLWNRICEGNASVLVEDALILSCSLASSGKDSWFKNLSAVVEDTGLSVKDIELDSSLLGDLPKKLRNLFLTRWELDLSRQGSKSGNGGNLLRTYNLFKHSFDMEPYLGCRNPLRSSLTRLRVGACNLRINLGRRHRPLPLPVEDRICDFCMSTANTRSVEDERHFIMQCPLYHSLRSVLFSEIIEFDSTFASLPDFMVYIKIAVTKSNCIGDSKTKMNALTARTLVMSINGDDYYYHLIMLYLPWHNETVELMCN